MPDFLAYTWTALVDALASGLVRPALAWLPFGHLAGDPRDIAGGLLIALSQLVIIAFVFRPLESLMPAERWSDRRLTTVDRNLTLLMVLLLNPLFAFIMLTPVATLLGDGAAAAASTDAGTGGLLGLIPGIDQHPWLAVGIYYLIYDLSYYWMHRAQHVIPWWWAMHSMHHSQRQMSCWSNDRSCLLDGFLQSIIIAGLGLVVGVDATQFALVGLLSELVQNFSHANVQLGFGRIFGRLFVDPKFHRLHHMPVDAERPNLHNCNFGQVLSVWDNLFGTALYDEPTRPTGVGDPVVDADNGLGVIAMQWAALKRFWGAVRCAEGWKIQEVAFEPGTYRPYRVKREGAEPEAATLP